MLIREWYNNAEERRGCLTLRRLQRRCNHFYEALRKRIKCDVKVIVKFDSKREC